MGDEWSLARVVSHHTLGPGGAVLSRNNGESREVRRLAEHPGWLLKLYRTGARTAQADRMLDWLVSLPDEMSETERSCIRASTAWPVCRVVGADQRTVGVVFREAPPWFRARFSVGPKRFTENVLQIDWLCQPAEACHRRGLPFFDFDERLVVCRSLVEVAAVLEYRDVVYGDWSYRNAFWSITERSGFLIDVDSCGFGSRNAVQTQAWRDPLVGNGPRIDVSTDRYGVALLVARCLTAERDRTSLLPALERVTSAEGRQDLYHVLRGSLAATTRDDRPPVTALLSQLTTARSLHAGTGNLPPGANVAGWELARAHATRGAPTPPPDRLDPIEPTAPATPSWSWFDVVVETVLDHPWPVLLTFIALVVLIVLFVF